MDTSELFRITLQHVLDQMPWGAQSKLADELGIEKTHLNGFLKGRRMFSESRREQIAEKLGYSYIDFLVMGREIINEKEKVSEIEDLKQPRQLTYAERKSFDALRDGYVHTLEFLVLFKSKGIYLDISSELKAAAVRLFHDNLMRNTPWGNISIDENRLADSISYFESEYDEYHDRFLELTKDMGFFSSLDLKAFLIAMGYISSAFIDEFDNAGDDGQQEEMIRGLMYLIKHDMNEQYKKDNTEELLKAA